MEDDTKRCPYCAETIQAAAVKCRFCDATLHGPTGPAPAPPPSPADRPSGVAALVVGLVALIGGFIACFPLLVGPVAWVLGSKHERQCRALGVEPDGPGKAGKIIGMISTVLLVLGVVVSAVFVLLVLVASGGQSSSPWGH